MPQFELNSPNRVSHPYFNLTDFAKGYVEAMFFTNGDTGDEREDLLNELGVERLTNASVDAIQAYCDRFEKINEQLVWQALGDEYNEEQAGRDLWFTAQGHGVGYWDRKELEADGLGDRLSEAASIAGEALVYVSKGWIHYQ